MNKLEILDAINGKKDEMRAIIDAGEAEQRKLTENEENNFKRLEEEIRGLKLELRKEENNELKANKKMEKRFSVLEAINDVINGRKHNEDVQAYLDETRALAANAGLGMNGQIQIDTRAVQGVVNAQTSTGEGAETVATETWDLLTALRDKSAIVKAGAQVYSNLVGDVEIPIMGRETVSFAGELDMVSGAPASFTSVSLKPQRVTCTVPVSKTWLRQNSPAVEAQLKNSIIDAINEKVEREILGDSATYFDGLMVSADTTSAVTYEDIVEMETSIEGNNMTTVFICDAKAKGALKLISRQEGSTIAVWNEGQIDDMPTYVTNAIKSTDGTKGNIVAVDASQVVIGYWGDVLDIVVDPYSRSRENIVNIVVTTYVDSAVVRDGAYKGLALTAE